MLQPSYYYGRGSTELLSKVTDISHDNYLSQLYTLLYQRLCIMISCTNNKEFIQRFTFTSRTYSLDLAEETQNTPQYLPN